MTDYLHFLVRVWPVIAVLIGLSLIVGILIGIGLQKNHTVRIWHKQRRIHKEQLVRARIRAKMQGAIIGRMSARANLMPDFGKLANDHR